MKYSTGRNTRVKHSTATEEEYINRKSHRRPRPQHSTGRESTINHFTGMRFDMRREEEHARAQDERAAFEEATRWGPPQHA